MNNHRCFLWLAIGGSLFLSLWKIHFSPLVNTDAILYLVATRELLSSGLSESLAVYNWPFFQIAIAAIHQITGLELLTSARVLMAACFILLVLAFCRVTRVLGGDDKTLWFALLVILCHTIVNDFRASLVRDPGMIAFVLLALAEQVRLADSGRWRHALLWSLCIGIAFLFRVEALAIAAAAPLGMFLLFSQPLKARALLAAKMLAGPAVSVVVIALALPAHLRDKIRLHNDFGFLQESVGNLSAKIESFSEVISTEILAEFSRDDATLALIAVIATITLANILRAFTLPYVIPLAISWLSSARALTREGRVMVGGYSLIIFAYLFSFALFARFSLTRYSLLLALVLLLPLAFHLRHWWRGAPRRRLVRGAIVFLFVANAADSLISGDWKKAYIRDAALWAAESPAIRENGLITNEPYLAYFSNKSETAAVLRAIYPKDQLLGEKMDLYWLPGYVYAHRVRQGEAASQLDEDISRGDGKIIQIFEGQDDHAVYLFSVSRKIERSPKFIELS